MTSPATSISDVRGTKTEVKPGVWRLRAYVGLNNNGNPVQVSRTVRGGIRAADKALRNMLQEVDDKKLAPNRSADTVGSLLAMWLEHQSKRGRSATTLREYRRLVASKDLSELSTTPLDTLTAHDLDRLYDKLTARGLRPTSVRRVHALISAALRQAERWGMVEQSVARRATPPPVHLKQVTAPPPEDVQRLIEDAEQVEPMMGALLFVAAITGARRGELCALRWSDIDWVAGTLNIDRAVYETAGGGWGEKPTKTHAGRRIALGDVGLVVLQRHRSKVDRLADELGLVVPDDAFIFSRSPQGLEPVRPDVVTKFVLRVSNGRVHLHALRHYSATQLIAGGHDVRTVAGRLGHADVSVTLRVYCHVLPERDREAAAALGNTLTLPSA